MGEARQAARDRGLGLESYRLEGVARAFPVHFHDYYVLGLVESGERRLRCGGRELDLGPGELLFLNPGDSHGCVRTGGALDYRGLNIPSGVMTGLAEAVGKPGKPILLPTVLRDEEAARLFRRVHNRVMSGETGGPEDLLRLLALLLGRGELPVDPPAAGREEVARACAYMEENLARRITLDQLCRQAGLGRSALLRAFLRERKVTPYRWLEVLRVGRARELLAQGVPPAEAALRAGFSDQSHLTHCFTRFLGLPPGVYRDSCKEE